MTRLQAYNILSQSLPRFRGILKLSGVEGMNQAVDVAVATLRVCAEAETQTLRDTPPTERRNALGGLAESLAVLDTR